MIYAELPTLNIKTIKAPAHGEVVDLFILPGLFVMIMSPVNPNKWKYLHVTKM